MVSRLTGFKISSFVLSDVGLVRENNEDAWAEALDVGCFTLADGMGGHRAGEIASREAVLTLCQLLKNYLGHGASLSTQERVAAVQKAIEQVNSLIYQLGHSDDFLRGMGTTLCCLQFENHEVITAHVGDSRIYRLRNKSLEQLSNDHSLVKELQDLGLGSDHQVSDFLYKSIITRAIGAEPHVTPSIKIFDLQDKDLFVMCSDGLSDMLFREEIETVLNQSSSVEEGAKKLISSAIARGGHDNVTVFLIQVEENHGTNDQS